MKIGYDHGAVKIYCGDAREVLAQLPERSVNCCVTSPPYWGLRDYGVVGQLGLEQTPEKYVATMVSVFQEVKRVLRDDGTLWLNVGDSYHNGDKGGYAKDRIKAEDSLQKSNLGANFIGAPNRQPHPLLKPKDLVGVPWMLAFALRADGWYLRSDIIWHKPNSMPESVTDRPTKAHEYIFLLSKKERYFYNGAAIEEPASMASLARWDQDVENQHGSLRANGGAKTNGNMKAVGGPDKQRGHSRRHDGFNDRWDAMEKEEQCGGTRQKRDVWTVSPQPFPDAHFATFPEELIKPCILAGCPEGGTVLDPFMGSGTTALVARANGCNAIGIELNAEYIGIAKNRLRQDVLEFAG